MVLVGHSWGGQVAAAYLAAHPDHVAKVVFSSPGALAPALEDGSVAASGSAWAPPSGCACTPCWPGRGCCWPGPCSRSTPWPPMPSPGTPRWTPATTGSTTPAAALRGLGFYTFQFPRSAAARPWADPRPALARLATPALVVKGSCDYLSWSSGLAYRQALPGARLVYLRGAGHNAYQDQPAAFLAVVRAYLAGRPSPVPAWTGSGVPPDYEGPP